MEWMIIYCLLINAISYIVMGRDKQYAKKRQRRISERTLFTLALIGGSVGIYSGMKSFRHKTKHTSFTIGIPVIIFAQVGLIAFIFI